MSMNVMYAAIQNRRRAWGMGTFGDRSGDIASSDAPGAPGPFGRFGDVTSDFSVPDLGLGATPLTSTYDPTAALPDTTQSGSGAPSATDTSGGVNWGGIGAGIGNLFNTIAGGRGSGTPYLMPGGPGSPGLVPGPSGRNYYPASYGQAATPAPGISTGTIAAGGVALLLAFLIFKK